MSLTSNTATSSVERTTNLPPYSVLMSVYELDNPEWFEEAIVSMVEQTWKPDEIIIMEDGKLPSLLRIKEKECLTRYPGLISCIPHNTRQGLAKMLAEGIQLCKHEWIARMDADDISAPTRCEKELACACKEKADLVSCGYYEFYGIPENIIAKRKYPSNHEELVCLSKRRSPLCHAATMMKKSKVIHAGNYRSTYVVEDYDLFVRMLSMGCKACTVDEYLYNIRVGKEYYDRRSGWRYIKSNLKFNYYMVEIQWCTWTDYIIRSASMIMVCLAPGWFRAWFYRRVLRD